MRLKQVYFFLLSSTIILTGCGNDGDSSPDFAPSLSSLQSEISSTSSNLKSLQAQSALLQNELAAQTKLTEEKKANLDALQGDFAQGRISSQSLASAQELFNQASARLRELERKKVELADQIRQASEQLDTLSSKVELNTFLNNLGPKCLSGELDKADFDKFIRATNSNTAQELVAPFNKFITDIKFGLKTGEKIRSVAHKAISSPLTSFIVKDFLVPYFAPSIHSQIEAEITTYPSLFNRPEGEKIYALILFGERIPLENFAVKPQQTSRYTLEVPFKEVIKLSTAGLQEELSPYEYSTVINFIDKYFRENPTKIQEILKLNLQLGNPNTLTSSLTTKFEELQPVFSDVVSKMPVEWLNWFAENIQEIPLIDIEDAEVFKHFINEMSKGISRTSVLSSSAPISASNQIAFRASRRNKRSIDLDLDLGHPTISDYNYALNIPIQLKLKGKVNTSSSTTDLIGSATYKLNSAVVGLIQGFGNANILYSESSLLLSKSFNHFFIEGQTGFVKFSDGLLSTWEGSRYQVSVGYDTGIISPFIQFNYTPLHGILSTLDSQGIYIGFETDVLKIQTAEATFSSNVLMKIGYESSTESLLDGKSLKPNQGVSMSVDWTGKLLLSAGLKMETGLTLGPKDKSVKFNINFEN